METDVRWSIRRDGQAIQTESQGSEGTEVGLNGELRARDGIGLTVQAVQGEGADPLHRGAVDNGEVTGCPERKVGDLQEGSAL